MSQFVLYKNPNRSTQKNYPYLLDIQSNLLDELRTTVVIPLMPEQFARNYAMTTLNPPIKVGNESFMLMTQHIAGVDRDVLGEKVCEVSEHRAEIVAAIDFVVSGI